MIHMVTEYHTFVEQARYLIGLRYLSASTSRAWVWVRKVQKVNSSTVEGVC